MKKFWSGWSFEGTGRLMPLQDVAHTLVREMTYSR
jgi:hypothetical protein